MLHLPWMSFLTEVTYSQICLKWASELPEIMFRLMVRVKVTLGEGWSELVCLQLITEITYCTNKEKIWKREILSLRLWNTTACNPRNIVNLDSFSEAKPSYTCDSSVVHQYIPMTWVCDSCWRPVITVWIWKPWTLSFNFEKNIQNSRLIICKKK